MSGRDRLRASRIRYPAVTSREGAMRKSYPLVVNGQRQTYAKGVLAEGRYIFLSGVLSTEGSMGDQATRVWDEIKSRLADLGGRPENIVQRMTFVTDIPTWRAEGAPK